MNHKHKAKRQERPKVIEARRWRTRDGVLLVAMAAVGMLIGASYWNYGDGATQLPASPALVAESHSAIMNVLAHNVLPSPI
ncbi:MAG: hypothetical protein K8U03_22135 [Planctomycetia bacterium]|nr:hypothetical protein [Planctomycetia bacterium]